MKESGIRLVFFLEKCEELGVIHNSLLFKVSNNHLRNSKTYLNCWKSLLNEELEHKRSSIRRHRRDLLLFKSELQQTLNVVDYSHFLSFILQTNDKYIDSHKDIQDKKLHKLLERSKAFCNDPKRSFIIFPVINFQKTKKVFWWGVWIFQFSLETLTLPFIVLKIN